MTYMNGLRYLTDVVKDPAFAKVRKNFTKGFAKDPKTGEIKKALRKGRRKSSEFIIKPEWQRNIKPSQIEEFGQFDAQLATYCVVYVRPPKYGGLVIEVDGQHTATCDIFGECDAWIDTLELHHDENSTLEDIEKAEGTLYKVLNTKQKKLSELDIIRVDIFLGDIWARNFESVLKSCNLNLDNIGARNGDIIKGKGARMIKCAKSYIGHFDNYIIDAVNLMREMWGTPTSPLRDYNDAFIHALTTLLVFLDYAGNIDGGTTNGLNGRKLKVKEWMKIPRPNVGKSEGMCGTSIRKYCHNTAGGNTHFKIVHNLIEEYNEWAKEHAPTMTIDRKYVHDNGIYDPEVYFPEGKKGREMKKSLPTFPKDINI